MEFRGAGEKVNFDAMASVVPTWYANNKQDPQCIKGRTVLIMIFIGLVLLGVICTSSDAASLPFRRSADSPSSENATVSTYENSTHEAHKCHPKMCNSHSFILTTQNASVALTWNADANSVAMNADGNVSRTSVFYAKTIGNDHVAFSTNRLEKGKKKFLAVDENGAFVLDDEMSTEFLHFRDSTFPLDNYIFFAVRKSVSECYLVRPGRSMLKVPDFSYCGNACGISRLFRGCTEGSLKRIIQNPSNWFQRKPVRGTSSEDLRNYCHPLLDTETYDCCGCNTRGDAPISPKLKSLFDQMPKIPC
ncbi:uncharacterized protein [Oscarella lobularis]|uniref:uncharacterized protein isoform X2 n=1 Tax=Oscarella lobularis TaxID=121494 RepID=UPI0033138C6E